MHPSSNVESPTNDSSQNPQFCSQAPPPTTPNTCYRPSLSNIESPSNKVESPIGLDNIQLVEGEQNSSGNKNRIAFLVTKDVVLVRLGLTVSKNSITRVNQTSQQYWTRIKKCIQQR
ncbi:hypothetical protein GmHk_10G029224 [Glycine max]|nr:hypothetical protein GmHk_10G029224 [Glycine max]